MRSIVYLVCGLLVGNGLEISVSGGFGLLGFIGIIVADPLFDALSRTRRTG